MHAHMQHTQVEQWIERERVTMQKEREEKEQSILSQKLNSLGMRFLLHNRLEIIETYMYSSL
jgi:hypothetical protein